MCVVFPGKGIIDLLKTSVNQGEIILSADNEGEDLANQQFFM